MLKTAIDPITFEVIKHRLWQINDEQGIAIKLISASPIVVEGNDFNTGLFTDDGQLVTAGIGSSVHVGTMGTSIRSIIQKAKKIRDGDIFLHNDPFLGALHQNDVVIASPLFRDGRIVLWVGNVLHYPDVGGIDEGSFCVNARNLYQEPPRYFLKVVDQGELVNEVEYTFVNNSRLPDMVSLDLRAQIGAIHVAKKRLNELIDEYGSERIMEVMRRSIDVSEQKIREMIRRLPEGAWHATAYMDGIRVGSEKIVKVQVQLSKQGDRLRFDFTGSDPQVDAAVNCTYHATVAAVAVPIYSFLCRGIIDWNDGAIRCLEVIAPEGTVVNAKFPAPVSILTLGFRWLATAAANLALAKMLAASPEFEHLVCPSWVVSANGNNIFGFTPEGKRVGALLSDHRAGGAGGRSFADGFDHAGQITSFASTLGNVESTEWKLPILYLYRRQLPDSGGPGQFRGGLTAESALIPYGVSELIYKSTNTAGTKQSNASGIKGGYPGAGSQVTVVKNSNIQAYLRERGVPLSYRDLEGEVQHLPSKADGVIRENDVYIFHAPGGGGYGDPLDRDPELVRRDVRNGWVSLDRAKENYGVVFNEEGEVDAEASRALREKLRTERFERASKRRKGEGVPEIVSCPCGGEERVFAYQPLAKAGPWINVRDQGMCEEFELEEMYCASCRRLLAVSEVKVN